MVGFWEKLYPTKGQANVWANYQIIPHVTNHIQQAIAAAGKDFDVHIVEIGGTVGGHFESPKLFGSYP